MAAMGAKSSADVGGGAGGAGGAAAVVTPAGAGVGCGGGGGSWAQPAPLAFDIREIERFRYRVEDTLKKVCVYPCVCGRRGARVESGGVKMKIAAVQ